MPCRNGATARALAGAGLALLVAFSCPNPIDDDLLLVVEDDITPSMVISEPLPNSYYHGDVTVTGTIADSSQQTGDGKGRLLTLSFSVSDASTLDRTVTFAADGNATVSPVDPLFAWDLGTGVFSFSFPSDDLYGFRILTFVARDLNGNESRQQLALQPYPFGPNLQLDSPDAFDIYDMQVEISGTVTDAPGETPPTADEVREIQWKMSTEPLPHKLVIDPTNPPPGGIYTSGTFTFDPSDGSFYDVYDCSGDRTPLILLVSAWNVNSSSSTTVQLLAPATGPAIVLAPRATGHNPTEYSSMVKPSITVDGTVDTTNLNFSLVRYKVVQNPGLALGAFFTPESDGTFSFTFPTTTLAGNLSVEVYAKDNRGTESMVEYTIYDDQNPPGAPDVSGPTSPTNDGMPRWTWTTPPTTVDFEYHLDPPTGSSGVTTDAFWEPAASLSEGSHTLHVCARDSVGNTSSEGTNTLFVDTAAPSVSFLINSGAAWTVSRDVTLTIAASDPVPASGLYQMRIRNDSDAGSWEAYSSSKSWQLASTNGSRTVWVDIKDNAGNITTESHTIGLDTVYPSVTSFLINGVAEWTTSRNVTLTIAASDPVPASGLDQMRIRNDSDAGSWEAYSGTKNWQLASTNGTRRVWADIRDTAGNITSIFDDIGLDTSPPSVATFVINGGFGWTVSRDVTITIDVSDAVPGSGLDKMHLRNEGDVSWGTWETITGSRDWQLPDVDDEHLFVQSEFRDIAGNITPVSDSIGLDRSNPSITTFVINNDTSPTSSLDVALTIAATDGPTGTPYQMHFSNNGSTWSGWEPYNTTKSWTLEMGGDGLRTVYIEVNDRVGYTDSANDTIDYDGP
jgi:hypothetical protein